MAEKDTVTISSVVLASKKLVKFTFEPIRKIIYLRSICLPILSSNPSTE